MERTKTILLTANGVSQVFDIDHAERLLGMPHNGGWVIPEDSKFIYTNGIITRKNKGTSEKSR